MELRGSIPEWVHPAGAPTIDHWIVGALDALDHGELAEADRLERMVRDKVELERKWREENKEPWPIELIEWLIAHRRPGASPWTAVSRSARYPHNQNRSRPFWGLLWSGFLAIVILVPLAPQAVAQSRGKADPNWPCRQIKTPTFSLASVWVGPPLDLNSQAWRDESDVADLKAQMAQRRVPIADVEKAITEFKTKAGPDAEAKLLRALAAAFEDLSQQRSQIIEGLDRFGRKQNALTDRIHADNAAVPPSSDQKSDAQAPAGASSQDKLLRDIRI
jgi:hypothetical protein